jgi:prevent-host-death family protein
MRTIGAFEAKNTFGTLLDWVEAGEEVIITRRGRAVARLVTYQASGEPDRSEAAAARIRARAAAAKGPFVWQEWKALRDEGRA